MECQLNRDYVKLKSIYNTYGESESDAAVLLIMQDLPTARYFFCDRGETPAEMRPYSSAVYPRAPGNSVDGDHRHSLAQIRSPVFLATRTFPVWAEISTPRGVLTHTPVLLRPGMDQSRIILLILPRSRAGYFGIGFRHREI